VRPSKQLLDFYRKKIIQYENEHDIVVKKLSEYSKSHEDEHYLECEVKQRDEEIAELQKALTDMQLFLFKEREQVLQLYTENDTFKVCIVCRLVCRYSCSCYSCSCYYIYSKH